MAGDLVLSTDSHQQALIATLNEHASLYGLKAKVLSRDEDEFPGGFQFHMKKKDYMKQLMAGEKNAYIFHMSWTLNKDNKLLFFRQLGEWYVEDQCIQKQVDSIEGGSDDIIHACCSAEPLFSCHYRDKPSREPCKDSGGAGLYGASSSKRPVFLCLRSHLSQRATSESSMIISA